MTPGTEWTWDTKHICSVRQPYAFPELEGPQLLDEVYLEKHPNCNYKSKIINQIVGTLNYLEKP